MKNNSPLKVGLVGLAHLHPRAYMPLFEALPETEVVAACDADATLRDSFAAEFGLTPYATLASMLAAEALDVAAVFLPHADSPDGAVHCAEAGLHLMVEKPMAADAAGAARIVRAAAAHGVKLTTGYCWRLHPAAIEMKRLVQDGALGRIVSAEGRCAAGRLQRYRDGGSPWMLQKSRAGGGPMFNLGVHWIDWFRWLFEDEVVEVGGRNLQVDPTYDIEDNSFAHLVFGSGVLASLDISYTVPDAYPHGRDLHLSVRGTRGVIAWDPAYEGERDILRICSDAAGFAGAPRREQVFELAPVRGYSGVMGLDYVSGFARAILTDTPPPIAGENGVAALRVVEAVYRASETRQWIPLDPPPGESTNPPSENGRSPSWPK